MRLLELTLCTRNIQINVHERAVKAKKQGTEASSGLPGDALRILFGVTFRQLVDCIGEYQGSHANLDPLVVAWHVPSEA